MDLGGKKWLKIDMSDPDSLFGMLGKSTDPELMFKAMEEPKEFELLGTEEVDGVETNHYRVVMDTAAYAEAMEMPAADARPRCRGHRGGDVGGRRQPAPQVPPGAGGPCHGRRPATTSTTEGTYPTTAPT